MATVYTVEHNGQVFDIEGPDNASPEQLQAFLGSSTPAQQNTPLESQKKGLLGQTMDVLGAPGRGIAALAYGAGQLGHAPSDDILLKMGEIAQPGFQPQNRDERLADVSGTLTNLAVPVGEGLTLAGKAVKATGIAPKAAAIAKGLFSSTKSAGNAIAGAEKAVGIATEKVVSIPKGGQGLTKVLNDIKDTGDLVKAGLKQDTPEFLQALKDRYDQASGILDQGQRAVGKKNFALAAQAKQAISDALNTMVPGRQEAQLAARTAYIRNNALKAGIVLGAAHKAKDIISNTLGGR